MINQPSFLPTLRTFRSLYISVVACTCVTAQLQNRMDIPIGVPDLDDRYSNGLASYIGVPALPGMNSNSNNNLQLGPQARSGGSSAPGNSISGLYNQFPMPQLQPNTAGMSKWYGPEFAPPVPNRGPFMPPQGPPPQQPVNTQKPDDGSIQVGDLSCNQLKSVIGMSNDRNHWLSTVECECRLVQGRQPEYACYSLCDGPRYAQRCDASFSILNSCPTYRNCGNWTQSNFTDSGAISCSVGSPVPESVCWILASAVLRVDETPLRPAFYANAAGGCFMSCLCGNDGTIAGQIQCLKAPTSRWMFPVYPRAAKFDFSQSQYN